MNTPTFSLNIGPAKTGPAGLLAPALYYWGVVVEPADGRLCLGKGLGRLCMLLVHGVCMQGGVWVYSGVAISGNSL